MIVPTRSMIAPEHTWDARSIFPSDAAWESEIALIDATLPDLDRFRGHLGDSPATLADWFVASEDLVARADRARIYALLYSDTDTTDRRAAAMYDRTFGLYTRARAAAATGEPELLAIGFDTLRRW